MYDIEIYKSINGKSEIEDYLKYLQKQKYNKDKKIKFNKIVAYIDLLSKYGLTLNEKYLKHIENEIWELRPLRDRILFASIQKDKFVLLSIFMKQTQKTPKKEIQKAKKLLNDYKERMKI